MQITFINNGGGGFADKIEVGEDITVGELFDQKVDGDHRAYYVRVNRQEVSRDTVLQAGDSVSVTPSKIEGAE